MDQRKLNTDVSTSSMTPLVISVLGTSTSAGQMFVANTAPPRKGPPQDKKIEDAIYSHLQAVRALGHTQVTVSEVASALRLDATVVQHHMHALRDRGVISR